MQKTGRTLITENTVLDILVLTVRHSPWVVCLCVCVRLRRWYIVGGCHILAGGGRASLFLTYGYCSVSSEDLVVWL